MFSTLKKKRSPKFLELAGSTQTPEKIIGTSKQPMKTTISPKKGNEPKICLCTTG
jgi:hypothetical protein